MPPVRFFFIVLVGVITFETRLFAQSESKSTSAVATALTFTHQFGLPQALEPGKDRQLKLKLITALSKSPGLPFDAVSEFFDRVAFQKLAGEEKVVSLTTMERLVREQTPQSRKDLNAKTRQHADLLTTQFELIEEDHRERAERLASWIVKHYQSGKPLGVIVICTGNTRRSILGSTLGNLAAAYAGLTDLRFFSGGTTPDAFNSRTIATLSEIGVEITPTGKEAARGTAGNPNPIYRVRWGKDLETLEFSKKYGDAHNPSEGFAAVLVCSEADTSCPQVTGAGLRIPVPYLDPKAFDGAGFEAGKYAERRDDIGRFMLNVALQARRQLELAGKLK